MGESRTAVREGAAPARVAAADPLFALAALLVGVSAVLGGASRENAVRLAAVELCALPLAAVSLRRVTSGARADGAAGPLALLSLILAVPLLQMIPLPPGVWTTLPGQGPRLEALRLARLPTPWAPPTLSPDATLRATLALTPPAALFMATARLGGPARRQLAWLWMALATAGLALGLVQIVTPTGGAAYPYRTTNVGSVVGLFANRNHEAGYLLALLPFAAALATRDRSRARWMAWPFILLSIVGLGVVGSRAGVILAAPALLAVLAVAWREPGLRLGAAPFAALAGAMVLTLVAVAVFGLDPILGRFDPRASSEFRFAAWPLVIDAARDFLPFGSGVGSFDRVFEAVEPLTLVGPRYFNHAHNDYLELWLETGWTGATLLALFLVWFGAAAWRAWRSRDPLAQASSAAIALLMAQSAVDYPLRTETLAVLFAFACALLAWPEKGPNR